MFHNHHHHQHDDHNHHHHHAHGAIVTPTGQVSITVVRKSDGQAMTFVLDEKTHIEELKTELRIRLKPKFKKGCRLIFREQVLKGKHSLRHYGIKKGVNDQAISSKPMGFSSLGITNVFFLPFQWMTQKTGNRLPLHLTPNTKLKIDFLSINV